MPHGTNRYDDESSNTSTSASLLLQACTRLWRNLLGGDEPEAASATATTTPRTPNPTSPSSSVYFTPPSTGFHRRLEALFGNGQPLPTPVPVPTDTDLARRAEQLYIRERALDSRAAELEARERREGLLTTRVRRVCERERIVTAATAELEGRVRALEAREGEFKELAEEQRQSLIAERQHFWALQRALSQVVANELEQLASEQTQLRADFTNRARSARAAVDAMRIAARQAAAAISAAGRDVPSELRAAAQVVLDETADIAANTTANSIASANGAQHPAANSEQDGANAASCSAAKPPLPPPNSNGLPYATSSSNAGSCSSARPPLPPTRTYEATNGREETPANVHQNGKRSSRARASTTRNGNGGNTILDEARSALKKVLESSTSSCNGEQEPHH